MGSERKRVLTVRPRPGNDNVFQAEMARVVYARAVTEAKLRERALDEAIRAGVRFVDFAETWGGTTRYILPRTRLGRWWVLWRAVRRRGERLPDG